MENALINGKIKSSKQSGAYKLMLPAAFALHLFVFIYFLIKNPVHIDEAMTILNANSLAKSGMDILGERLPIYFDTWLHGGQSPFATYLVALMIKLFGYSLFITRVPMFIFSMLGLMAFYKFLKEAIPENETLINIAFCLACISPWHLYSSAFTLDCNFLPHIAMFGLYFLAKGINTQKSRYFVFSMFFFGLGFYCYILSAIIIPTFLAILYLLLLIKKKISIKDTLISLLTIFVVAIPFILQGLVQFDVIDNLKLFGFSISKMEYYSRGLGRKNSFLDNLGDGIFIALFPDILSFNKIVPSVSFNYTNSIGGFLLILGIVFIISRKKEFSFIKIFFITSIISLAILCGLTHYIVALYRYNFYNYTLNFGIAAGLYSIKSIAEHFKINSKKIFISLTTVFILSSLIITSYCFLHYFSSDVLNNNKFYVNSMTSSLNYCKNFESDPASIILSNNDNKRIEEERNQRTYIATLFNNVDSYDKLKVKSTMLDFNYNKSNGKIPINNNLYLLYPNNKINETVFIANSDEAEKLKYDKSKYKSKKIGIYTVFYKEMQ